MASDLHENLLDHFPGALSAACDGHGWVSVEYPTGHGNYESAAHCPRCEQQKLRNAIGAFIPPRFRDPVEIPDEIRAWATLGDKAQGLYLAGQVGTGKTHAAWNAMALWCLATDTRPRGEGYSDWTEARTRPTVVFSRLTDLLDDFRPGDDSVQRVRDCQNARLLIIDDVGAEKPSEWTQERLYSVVDHRYANCMPLIVTGNLPPAKLAEQTGGRVASRLAEMCRDHIVPMTGNDRRRVA